MPFNPIMLKGHTRPITAVKYNREGDLLFSCGKDGKVTAWYSENGERLGTYNGHEGAVWDCDVDFNTTRLITGAADQSARLWDVETGKQIFRYPHSSTVRSVGWAMGDKMFLTVTDTSFGGTPTIFIYNAPEGNEVTEDLALPIRTMLSPDSGLITTAVWASMNLSIISASEDGCLRVWDTDSGVVTSTIQAHKKQIQSIALSWDQTMLITASSDQTASLYDVRTMKHLKTYKSDRPINAAAISPIYNHIILGGGQEAKDVTTTAARAGKFEVDFHHIVYQEYMGSVKGHFGPVNCLAFAPDGRSFVSGSEDGYLRLHHFDKSYHMNKHNTFESAAAAAASSSAPAASAAAPSTAAAAGAKEGKESSRPGKSR